MGASLDSTSTTLPCLHSFAAKQENFSYEAEA